MRNGIIIVFGKNDFDSSNALNFKSFFYKNIKICLVNNGNHDKVFKLLNALKDSSKCDISILNLRKEKTVMLAVKAGVRFLTNSDNISLIIHTNPKNICKPKLIDNVLELIDQELIKKKDERVLLRSVYSINEVFNYRIK